MSAVAVIVIVVVALLLLAAGARRATTARAHPRLDPADDAHPYRSHAEASRHAGDDET